MMPTSSQFHKYLPGLAMLVVLILPIYFLSRYASNSTSSYRVTSRAASPTGLPKFSGAIVDPLSQAAIDRARILVNLYSSLPYQGTGFTLTRDTVSDTIRVTLSHPYSTSLANFNTWIASTSYKVLPAEYFSYSGLPSPTPTPPPPCVALIQAFTDTNKNALYDSTIDTVTGYVGRTFSLYAGSSATGTPLKTVTMKDFVCPPGARCAPPLIPSSQALFSPLTCSQTYTIAETPRSAYQFSGATNTGVANGKVTFTATKTTWSKASPHYRFGAYLK